MSLVCRKAFFVLCRNGTGSDDVSYRVKKRLGYLTGIEGERGGFKREVDWLRVYTITFTSMGHEVAAECTSTQHSLQLRRSSSNTLWTRMQWRPSLASLRYYRTTSLYNSRTFSTLFSSALFAVQS